MELWLLCLALGAACLALAVKLVLLRRDMDQLRRDLRRILEEDTNVLLSAHGNDRALRRLAEDLNRELRLLRHERRRFQTGDRELRQAVTDLAHDLRTPLTAICGYLDLLEGEEKSEAAARYLAVIRGRAEAMRTLTEELFRYSVLTSAEQKLTYEPVTLNGALEEALSAQYAALRDRGITPDISIPEEKVVRRLDRTALARILENVLTNAVKYSGGDLAVRLGEDGTITVSNAAPGLTVQEVGRLFDRFYTVSSGRRSTGLGLSIARALTEQMGGTIGADCRDGRLCVQIRFREK